MSQKESQKENSQKAVVTQIQNRAIIVSSQGEVKSQLQAPSQDQVSSQVQDSQANSCVASQGQVLSQAEMASQHNISSQDSVTTQAQNVFSQPIVPTLSQISSQRSVSSSQGSVSTQKPKRSDIITDMPSLAAIIEAGQLATSSEDSQDAHQNNNE